MGMVRAPDHSARRPVSAYWTLLCRLIVSPDTGVRSHLSAGPNFLELGGLPLLEFHGYYLLSYKNFIVQAHRVLTDPARSSPPSVVYQATMAQGPLRTEPETFLLVRWVAA